MLDKGQYGKVLALAVVAALVMVAVFASRERMAVAQTPRWVDITFSRWGKDGGFLNAFVKWEEKNKPWMITVCPTREENDTGGRYRCLAIKVIDKG